MQVLEFNIVTFSPDTYPGCHPLNGQSVLEAVQRFRKRAEDAGEDALEDDWSATTEEGSDEEEEVYSQHKPIYAFWAEKGLIKPQNMRKSQTPGAGQAGGRKRRIQVALMQCLFCHEASKLDKALHLEEAFTL